MKCTFLANTIGAAATAPKDDMGECCTALVSVPSKLLGACLKHSGVRAQLTLTGLLGNAVQYVVCVHRC